MTRCMFYFCRENLSLTLQMSKYTWIPAKSMRSTKNYCISMFTCFYSRLFTQTFSYVERTATTKKQEDLEQLTLNLRQKLSGLKLQRISDGKKVDLHKYEIACLANFIRDEDTSVEEILSLVPSMARFQLDQIELAIGIVIEAKEHATAGL
mmetsp:Transcript_19337/g.32801  ORF Transcript_19337/g.32801 Transcript_19337/m.32801 type:complete len:151 (-) Transcript_19337:71-523(-)